MKKKIPKGYYLLPATTTYHIYVNENMYEVPEDIYHAWMKVHNYITMKKKEE